MEKLRIHVCGTDIHVTELGNLTTGMVGATASFSFSPEWNGLLKTAVFCSGIKKDVILTGDTVKIPPECLRTSYMTVGVYGHLADGTIVIPTVMSGNIAVSTGTKPSGDTQSGFTPDKWMQLLGMIGDLSQLTPEDKSSLVAAINEVAKKTGGEVDPAEVQRIVEGYLAAHPPTVTDEQIAAAVDNYFTKNPASGLTTAQVNALDGLFKIAAYTEDASGAYAAFQTAFGLAGGGEEPDEPEEPDVPVVKTYTVSSELVNVTSSNAVTSVNENASYTATLTAAEGYNLDSVTVTMGGVDITATAYADGVVTIAAVTGNVEIVASASVAEVEPELPTDSLIDFYDFRNIKTGTTPNGGYGVVGENSYLYSWATLAKDVETDDYGLPCGLNFVSSEITVGQNVTVCTLSYRGDGYSHNMFGWGKHIVANNNSTLVKPAALSSDGANVYGTQEQVVGNNGYNVFVISISETEFKVYVNGNLVITQKSSDIANFGSWVNEITLQSGYGQSSGVAAAIYNKTLSQVEVTEVGAYFKTLEVTA